MSSEERVSMEEKMVMEEFFKSPNLKFKKMIEAKCVGFVSPPQPLRMLMKDFNEEEDFVKNLFPKKQYKILYRRPEVDLKIILGCEIPSTNKESNNLIKMEDDSILEDFIKNY